jgi:hypothetical protein
MPVLVRFSTENLLFKKKTFSTFLLMSLLGGEGLDSVVILQPQFITRIMATIITTKQNFVKDGVVVVKNLFDQVWRQFPSRLHPMLLALLETFEVVFRYDFMPSVRP